MKQPKKFIYDSLNSFTIVDGQTHTLSVKENLFLKILIEQKRLITYSEIESQVYQHKDMSQNALRLFIKNLRKKLPKDYLLNVTNIGYKINPDSAEY
ncbi:MAG: helix-turn-helix domain-containing protein [Campylobacterales bacterium]|nr:helix-turn-helix domain-containing protein [Campylobacterales bacterium]